MAATEYSDAPLISHGTEWAVTTSVGWRSELADRLDLTRGWSETVFLLFLASVWLMDMNILWSRRTPTTQIAEPSPTPPSSAGIASTHVAPIPTASFAVEDTSTPLSGATSGVDSGTEEAHVPDVVSHPRGAEDVILDSNPRSRLSFVQ